MRTAAVRARSGRGDRPQNEDPPVTIYTISRSGLVRGSDGTVHDIDDLMELLYALRAQRDDDTIGLCGGRSYETRQPKPEYL
jgi:hypothetical protein